MAMYSLYRAWLLRESATACSNPDVLITVGTGRQSHQFAGHRSLLSSQSGYLKSLLASSETNQIVVPNISPDVFAPLLTFMYTGFLDLNPENIYAVLLATHLLHMPRASDLCRSYLIQHQQSSQFTQPPALIKPIPSRKMFPALLPPPPSGVYWPPPPYHPVSTQNVSTFRPIFPPLSLSKPETEVSETRKSPQAVPSTSAEQSRVSPTPSSLSPCLSQVSDSSDQVTVTVSNRTKSRKLTNAKVIVDVACCDGPVRFHRVLNHNYTTTGSKTTTTTTVTTATTTTTDAPLVQPIVWNKDDATSSTPTTSAEPSHAKSQPLGGDSGAIFTCHYCNHTFKSHYCYQKHARRHLNPVNVDLNRTSGKPSKFHKPAPKEHKKEPKLLDMNVQYYPCKTCGSKFPSYYFVHKHRKMCHPGEDSVPGKSTQSNPAEESTSSSQPTSV